MEPGGAWIEVDVLGSLRLRVDGAEIPVPGLQRRALLAQLALAEGRAVSVDTLVDSLWPDEPPATGSQALLSHVSRLRRNLGSAGALVRDGTFYRLDVERIDAAVARRLAEEVTGALPVDPERAARAARQALSLWGGEALEEFAEFRPLAAHAVVLNDLRARLRDDEIEARLAIGDVGVVDDAAAIARRDPLRERSTVHWIRSLAMAGRAADAMQVAADYRRTLADETGLDPAPSFARLEHDVAAGLLAAVPAAQPVPIARPAAPFVGREHDLEDLRGLIKAELAAVVTVTGPGGVGKTRIVSELAAGLSTEGEVALVHLATVRDPQRVTAAVGAALGLRQSKEGPDRLAEAVAGRSVLLVLDNCEHVVEACRDLVTSLRLRAAQVRILATSRVPLHVEGEYVVRLQPLQLSDGVAAFVEHAWRRKHGWRLVDDDRRDVEEIVRRLDGLPLAIELAAGQATSIAINDLRGRLGRALDLFEADRPRGDERHRTLRSTLDWSYRLLAEPERQLLDSLAPFVGGVDVDTVEQLASDLPAGRDPLVALSRLVDASLVAPDPANTGRYTLLETVRSYLLDRAGTSAGDRLLSWAQDAAREIGAGILGADEATADRRLRTELANLDAAASLALRRGDLQAVVDMVTSLYYASELRDVSAVGSWAMALATDPRLPDHPAAASMLGAAARGAWLAGDLDRCDELAEHGLSLDGTNAWCWTSKAVGLSFRARFGEARKAYAVAAEHADYPSLVLATSALSAAYDGDHDDARAVIGAARQSALDQPRPSHLAYLEYAEGELASASGSPEVAIERFTGAIARSRASGATFTESLAMVGLASSWAAAGRLAPAAEGYRHLLAYWLRAGNMTQLWTTVRNAARLLAGHGHPLLALALLQAADNAPTSAGMSASARERQAEMWSRLADQLGPNGVEEAVRRSATPAAELIEETRSALATLA